METLYTAQDMQTMRKQAYKAGAIASFLTLSTTSYILAIFIF